MARSQLTAALWARRSPVPARSAGTQPAARVHRHVLAVARRQGLDLRDASTAHVRDVPETRVDRLAATVRSPHGRRHQPQWRVM